MKRVHFILLALLVLAASCTTTKKIDKSYSKTDSSSSKHSTIDSSSRSFDFFISEKEDTSTAVTENTFEPHQVDSGIGIVITNGTAEEYIEILPSKIKRTIYLPKTKKLETKKSSSKNESAAAKEVAVKKETAEAVAVTHEEKEVHKDVQRKWFHLPWWLWLFGAAVLYLTLAYEFQFYPFATIRRHDDGPDE